MKIRFGVGLGADTGPEQLAEVVDHLEAAGVDSLWFSELVYSQLSSRSSAWRSRSRARRG